MERAATLEVAVWGVRGSYPVAGHEVLAYGGNTTCFLVTNVSSAESVVVDMGTGFIALGNHFQPSVGEPLNILLTHTHNDHLEGIRFSKLMSRPRATAIICGPPALKDGKNLSRALGDYFEKTYFPARLEWYPTKVDFVEVVADKPFEVAGITVVAHPVTHKDRDMVTFGYRFDLDGQSMAIIPDHELGIARDDPRKYARLLAWLTAPRAVEVLLHDAQYTAHEAELYRGFGHSTPVQACQLAEDLARVSGKKQPRVYGVHHDPNHTDRQIAAMAREVRQMNYSAAREGTVIDSLGRERVIARSGHELAG